MFLRTHILILPVMLLLLISTACAAEQVKATSTDKVLDNYVETVEFHNTSISDILRLLARQNDLNLIILEL